MQRERIPALISVLLAIMIVIVLLLIDVRAGAWGTELLHSRFKLVQLCFLTLILPVVVMGSFAWSYVGFVQRAWLQWLCIPLSLILFVVTWALLETKFDYQSHSTRNAIYTVCIKKKLNPQCSNYVRRSTKVINSLSPEIRSQVIAFGQGRTPIK